MEIDYEGRRKDYEMLERWANSEGTEQQRRYGLLARHYRMMARVDVDRFLGVA